MIKNEGEPRLTFFCDRRIVVKMQCGLSVKMGRRPDGILLAVQILVIKG